MSGFWFAALVLFLVIASGFMVWAVHPPFLFKLYVAGIVGLFFGTIAEDIQVWAWTFGIVYAAILAHPWAFKR